MCDFISWVEYAGRDYFLTTGDLDTKEGRELVEYTKDPDDLLGHGAIRMYWGLGEKGTNKEQKDLSTPGKLPQEIVKAVVEGRMGWYGDCKDILTPKAQKKYNRVIDLAWKEHNRIVALTSEKRNRVVAPALKEYNRVVDPAQAEYNRVVDPVWEEYNRVIAPAWKEYNIIQQDTIRKLIINPKNRRKEWQ